MTSCTKLIDRNFGISKKITYCDVGTLMNNIRYESTLRDKNKRREKGGLLGDKSEGNEEENEKILVQYIVLNLL